jgi:release factor glutamine methyltransferase
LSSDLLEAVPAHAQFDFVVSNPPYISNDEFEQLDNDVRNHEPRLALCAGKLGTEVIERMLPQVAARLRPGGMLLCEISPMIQGQVERLIDAQPQLSYDATIPDLAGLPRVVQAQRQD